MTDHLTSQALNFRAKILEGKQIDVAVVTLPPCDDVTTEHFLGKILYFKAKEKFELTLWIVFNM